MFTDSFIREHVLPEIEKTGGATVLASPYGMPPALLRMDKYQPPTWVVGMGYRPERVWVNDSRLADMVLAATNYILETWRRDAYSAIGYWVNDGYIHIEPVETYTNHQMAVEAAQSAQQLAIYALHTGETEWLPVRDAGAFLLPSLD